MFQARMYNRAPVAEFTGPLITYRRCYIRQTQDGWRTLDEQKRTLVIGNFSSAGLAESVIDSVLAGTYPGGRCKHSA